MDIKPIETRYKGYRMRSRVEARWGVFFDALGIQWEYEPEGYNLGKYGYYLPDFRLNSSVYVEIKPNVFREQSAGHDKCIALSDYLKATVLLVSGTPGDEHSVIVCQNGFTTLCGVWSTSSIGTDACLTVADIHSGHNVRFGWARLPDYRMVTRAMINARSARFEHGETPDARMDNIEFALNTIANSPELEGSMIVVRNSRWEILR